MNQNHRSIRRGTRSGHTRFPVKKSGILSCIWAAVFATSGTFNSGTVTNRHIYFQIKVRLLTASGQSVFHTTWYSTLRHLPCNHQCALAGSGLGWYSCQVGAMHNAGLACVTALWSKLRAERLITGHKVYYAIWVGMFTRVWNLVACTSLNKYSGHCAIAQFASQRSLMT
jgi:hypothetical protein